jgi:hypothetical protein
MAPPGLASAVVPMVVQHLAVAAAVEAVSVEAELLVDVLGVVGKVDLVHPYGWKDWVKDEVSVLLQDEVDEADVVQVAQRTRCQLVVAGLQDTYLAMRYLAEAWVVDRPDQQDTVVAALKLDQDPVVHNYHVHYRKTVLEDDLVDKSPEAGRNLTCYWALD